MCGIIFVADRSLVPALGDPAAQRKLTALERARDVMRMRGPDKAGGELLQGPRAGGVWLGHRRLSIVDLSEAGTQPMRSDCGRFIITFNGEIYNAAQLRAELEAAGRRFRSSSDTEVIVTGFAEWGEAIVPRLIGMFAFAIWDSEAERLFAARDRLGIKPLHYVATERRCALASDARSLQSLGLVGTFDREALGGYLVLGYVPAPLSIWAGAAKLPSGCTLNWTAGSAANIRSYWQPPDDTDGNGRSPATAVADLEALLDTVVADHLIADVPVGLFLSGGIDSSVIASAVAGNGRGGDIGASTIALPGGADESAVAEETARRLGLAWSRIGITAEEGGRMSALAVASLDEPLAYSAVITQYAVSRAAANLGRVVLSGDGGDEVFGGYRWYKRLGAGPPLFTTHGLVTARLESAAGSLLAPVASGRLRDRTAAARFAAASPLHGHLQRVFAGLRPDEIKDLMVGLSPARCEEVAIGALRRHDAPRLPFKRRMQRIDLMTFCQDAVLSKVDRTAMAFALEVRPPLLDHRIVEWGIARPLSPTDDSAPKGILRELVRRRGLSHLLSQPKRGFSLAGSARLRKDFMVGTIGCLCDSDELRLSPDWQSRLAADGSGYQNKLETLHFLSEWSRACDRAGNPGSARRTQRHPAATTP
jgi:asparagine synthase (glutamine-hydrolysing)